METNFNLNKLEEEYLVRIVESAVHVRQERQFFLWVRGQLQSLLPHEIMVCIQYGPANDVMRLECLHSSLLERETLDYLCHESEGLVARVARYFRGCSAALPCIIEFGGMDASQPFAAFASEMAAYHLDNALLHASSGFCRGGGLFFALFSLKEKPGKRHGYFLDLLLPQLQFAFLRSQEEGAPAWEAARRAPELSRREMDVMRWVSKGKTNEEISLILNLSALTVKNHMQRIYRKLDVHNRAQAVSRCFSRQLIEPPGS
jgi:transcriptional regulator EpsA